MPKEIVKKKSNHTVRVDTIPLLSALLRQGGCWLGLGQRGMGGFSRAHLLHFFQLNENQELTLGMEEQFCCTFSLYSFFGFFI